MKSPITRPWNCCPRGAECAALTALRSRIVLMAAQDQRRRLTPPIYESHLSQLEGECRDFLGCRRLVQEQSVLSANAPPGRLQ